MEIVMTPAKPWQLECRLKVDDFYLDVADELYIDYDGHGYYGTESEISNIPVCCEDIFNGKEFQPAGMGYVYWFNK